MKLNIRVSYVIIALLIGLGRAGRSMSGESDALFLLFSIMQGVGLTLLAYRVGRDIVSRFL
ncbi:MAG: hypothetical protein IKR18_10960 [Bacteroidaceae bacterium]|nr:hypothetical protein [Bacteroidaceae bacterium]